MFARLTATLAASAAALGAASALAMAAPAVPAVPASSTGTATTVPGVTLPPAYDQCGVWAHATDARGVLRYTGFSQTKPVTQTVLNQSTEGLGFVPRAVTQTRLFVLGDSVPYFLAIAPNGYLWSYAMVYTDPAKSLEGPMTWQRIPLTSGWKTFRAIAASSNDENTDGAPTYLYGTTTAGTLRRYSIEMTDDHRFALVLSGKTISTKAGDIKTMTWDRVQTVNGRRSDVLLATTTSGKLQEIVVPRRDPSKVVRKTLRGSSWQVFDSISSEICYSGGRAILGTTKAGAGFVYRDRNATNFSAADFSRASVIPVTKGTHFSN